MSTSQAVILMNRLRSKSSSGRAQQSQSSGEDSGGASGRHSHTNGAGRHDEDSSGSRSSANRKADGHASSSGVNQRSRAKEAENPQVSALRFRRLQRNSFSTAVLLALRNGEELCAASRSSAKSGSGDLIRHPPYRSFRITCTYPYILCRLRQSK